MGSAVSLRARSRLPPSPKSDNSNGSALLLEQVPSPAEPVADRFLPPELVESAVSVLTWNVAAVNNNPFEYWIRYDDNQYVELMMGVECFLEDPGEHDTEVGNVFTEEMFQELRELLEQEKMDGLDEIEAMWNGGAMRLRHRRIVSEFIKDKSLGSKRLISMPDRVTNTINVVTRKESGYLPPPVCRPSVINNFEGDLSTMDVWWEQWKRFMFKEPLTVRTKGGVKVLRPVEMLDPIPRSKYPAVTEDEERLAIPLQILCQAVFDAIIVQLMNRLSPDHLWQSVKRKICNRLYRRKHERTIEILAQRYHAVDIICLQEVAAVFHDLFQESSLAVSHQAVLPAKLDGGRDQNSVIALRKDAFVLSSIKEVTSTVAVYMQGELQLADGDLVAVEAQGTRDSRHFLIVSFHGDTNGLLTPPLVNAVDRCAKEMFKEHALVLGLDANVYEPAKSGQQSFGDFITQITRLGFTTCWGDSPAGKDCLTTCSARTSLQPQLNKAVRCADRISGSDMHPKDIIVFYRDHFSPCTPTQMGKGRQPPCFRDNTGMMKYDEQSIFPTLDFPSDHGILAVSLQPSAGPALAKTERKT